MKSWKTTIGGIVTAAGVSMQASDNATVKLIGLILAGLGAIIIGGSAKDSNVTGGTKQQ